MSGFSPSVAGVAKGHAWIIPGEVRNLAHCVMVREYTATRLAQKIRGDRYSDPQTLLQLPGGKRS